MNALPYVAIGTSVVAITISALSARSSRRSYLRSCERLGVKPLTVWQIITGRRP